jgi:hypothetical protein
MLRSLLLLVTTGLAQPPGAVLPGAPAVAPGRVAPPPPDSLTRAIEARQQGDLVRAAWLYESWLGGKRGDGGLRAAVQLALGLVYLDLDEPSLASASFSRVRASGAPAAPWGAWYEALADHTRGRHTAASAGCQAYRKKWPTGPHADECLVLIGDASVAARQRGSAVAAYQAYLDAHPDSPRDEPLRLGIALAVSTCRGWSSATSTTRPGTPRSTASTSSPPKAMPPPCPTTASPPVASPPSGSGAATSRTPGPASRSWS